jgi:hypothetical protein
LILGLQDVNTVHGALASLDACLRDHIVYSSLISDLASLQELTAKLSILSNHPAVSIADSAVRVEDFLSLGCVEFAD